MQGVKRELGARIEKQGSEWCTSRLSFAGQGSARFLAGENECNNVTNVAGMQGLVDIAAGAGSAVAAQACGSGFGSLLMVATFPV
jgi:hypothetical protein